MNRDWLPIRTTPWTLGLILLTLVLLVQISALPQRLDFWLYDQAITSAPPRISDDVVLVTIDERSLGHLGRWPWPRNLHAELVSKLHQAGAKTIVFDILFSEPSPDDALLAKAMRRHGNVFLPVYLSPPTSRYLLQEQLPVDPLASAAAGLGHAHVELDSDGVARGLCSRHLIDAFRRVSAGLAESAVEWSRTLVPVSDREVEFLREFVDECLGLLVEEFGHLAPGEIPDPRFTRGIWIT